MSARCKHGGPAPCVDDLCHNCEPTLCGIWLDDELGDEYEQDDGYDDPEYSVWGHFMRPAVSPKTGNDG
jgi:hypothetical protein